MRGLSDLPVGAGPVEVRRQWRLGSFALRVISLRAARDRRSFASTS